MTVSLVSFISTLRGSGKANTAPAAAAVDATVAATVAVAANVATLVADGASPTQAHVTTLAANWAILLAAATVAQTAAGHSVTVTVDVTDISTVTKLNEIFRSVEFYARSSGLFTG